MPGMLTSVAEWLGLFALLAFIGGVAAGPVLFVLLWVDLAQNTMPWVVPPLMVWSLGVLGVFCWLLFFHIPKTETDESP
jgi:hypothetical protein